MIPIPRTSTPKPKSNKYHYKTSHASSRSFTPLAIQPHPKKDSRLKVRKQQNQNLHPTDILPFTNVQIRAPLGQSRDFNSTKPLDLTQYHKKESFVLKKKNDLLTAKLNDQEKELQLLKAQLVSLKSSLKENHEIHYKETGELKSLNQQLRKRFQSQAQQIDYLRKEMRSLKNDYSFNQDDKNGLKDERIQDRNQVSRRVQYAQHYEQVIGIINKENEFCNKCGEKQKELQQMRLKYSNELRSLQNYVSFLKEKELVAEVLEKQVANKNQCIDYLRKQLQVVQSNSNHLLQVIRSLEQRVQEVAYNKVTTWTNPSQPYRSFTSYKR